MTCHWAGMGLLVVSLAGGASGRAENACRAEGGLPASEGLVDPRGGLSLQATLTQDASTTISLAELQSRKAVPAQAWKLYQGALKADRKGDYEAAEELTGRALKDAPGFFQAHAGLASLRLREGRIEEADAEIEAALRLDPNYLPGWELLGIAAFLGGDVESARSILADVVARDPGRGSAHYFLGRTLCETGHGKSAAEQFETALRLRRHPIQVPTMQGLLDEDEHRPVY